MSKSISGEMLSKEIMKALEGYADDISDIVEKDANEIGKEAVKTIKQESPKGATGEYAKSWRLRKDKKGKNSYIVKLYNKDHYQLTHLLEFGHATADGGHTEAQPHIRPVEQEYSKKFEDKLKQDIGGLK
jgi:hypothetical protein|nr:MAG TPA: putative tail component [Caudoviricetes sp.]